MQDIKGISDFLFLFEKEDGLKFLSHDIQSSGIDFIDYVYSCERMIIREGLSGKIPSDSFGLVKGFVFGPSWRDFRGVSHEMFLASERCMSYYDTTGAHPQNCDDFKDDIDAFKHSIRFRQGRLYSFLNEEMKEFFPSLDITVKKNVKGADFYTGTRHLRDALSEILASMNDFKEHPEVVVGYEEDENSNPEYVLCKLSIEQVGSYPSHTLERDMDKLHAGGGTLSNIRKSLEGYANWSVISRWNEGSAPKMWNILTDSDIPEVQDSAEAEGFKHVITVYQKKRAS